MKLRRLREGDVLDDCNLTLVRADAMRHHDVYGSYGVSVFATRGATLDEMAQHVPLVRFARLTLLAVGDARRAGLRLEPTGRNPRHYTVAFDDLDHGIEALAGCLHQVVPNPYHDA
jgi:hypothetical protein